MIVYDCEFPPDHHIEIRISHEIRTYSTVRGEAIKAVTKQIRKGKNIAKRAGQTPPDNEAMRGSISNALNELGAVASEGAQALRAFRSCERITKGTEGSANSAKAGRLWRDGDA